MSLMLRIFKHLLPRGRAWSLTIDKPMRRFFEGLTGVGSDARAFLDGVWSDIFPASTRALSEGEQQFGLSAGDLTEAQRRERLAAAWEATGGQSPRYIQDTLQAAGFPVFVHFWWVPGTEPAVGVAGTPTARDPLDYLRRESAGAPEPGKGYPLVNHILRTRRDVITLCGEPFMECGEPAAECGDFEFFGSAEINYIIPSDPATWPYFLYIGAETFGDLAEIPASRRREFEELCLQICPLQQWLGILVTYV